MVVVQVVGDIWQLSRCLWRPSVLHCWPHDRRLLDRSTGTYRINDLYTLNKQGWYWYTAGVNWRAYAAYLW